MSRGFNKTLIFHSISLWSQGQRGLPEVNTLDVSIDTEGHEDANNNKT